MWRFTTVRRTFNDGRNMVSLALISPWLQPPLVWFLVAIFGLSGWCIYRIVIRARSSSPPADSNQQHPKSDGLLRDWVMYVVIALLIVAGAIVAALADVDTDHLFGWVTPILTAAFSFGFAAKAFWSHRGESKFWGTLASLAIAHAAMFFLVISPTWRWNPLLVAIVGIPELFVLLVALGLVLKASPDRNKAEQH